MKQRVHAHAISRTLVLNLACVLLLSGCAPSSAPPQTPLIKITPDALTEPLDPPPPQPIAVEYLPMEEVKARLDALVSAFPEVYTLPESSEIDPVTPGMWEIALVHIWGSIQKHDITTLGKALVEADQGELLPIAQAFGLGFEGFTWRFSADTYGEPQYSICEYLNGEVIELIYDEQDRRTLHLLFVREKDTGTYRFALLTSAYRRYGSEPDTHIWELDGALYAQIQMGDNGGTGAYEEIQAIIPLQKGTKAAYCYNTTWYENYGDVRSMIAVECTGAELLEDGRIGFQFLAEENYGVTELVQAYTTVRYTYAIYDNRNGKGLYAQCNDAPIQAQVGKRLGILALCEDEDTRQVAEENFYTFSFEAQGYPYLSKPALKKAVQSLVEQAPYTPAPGQEKIYLQSVGITPAASGTLTTNELEALSAAMETYHKEEGGATPLQNLLAKWGLQLSGEALYLQSNRNDREFSVRTHTDMPVPVKEIYIYQSGDMPPQIHLFFAKETAADVWTFCSAFQRGYSYFPILSQGVYPYGLLSMGERLYYQYGESEQGILLHPLQAGEPIHCYDGHGQGRIFLSILEAYPMFWPRNDEATGKPACGMVYNMDIAGVHGQSFEMEFHNDFDGKGFYTYNTDYMLFEENAEAIPSIRHWADEALQIALQSSNRSTREAALRVLGIG